MVFASAGDICVSVGTVRGAGPLDRTTCTVVPGSTTAPATSSGWPGTLHEITDPWRHVLVERRRALSDLQLLGGQRGCRLVEGLAR